MLEINTATFTALAKILSTTQTTNSYDQETASHAWGLWSRGIPTAREAQAGNKSFDNQMCLTAYVSALQDVYRLIQSDLSVELVQRMLTLLRDALKEASAASYVIDVEHATPLQAQVLEVLTMVRTDLPGVPSAMITQVAEFVSLAFNVVENETTQEKPRRSYVAMSKSSMAILQDLVLQNASDPSIYVQGAFTSALASLAKPITLKYKFPIVTKGAQPWRVATTTAIAVLSRTLPELARLHVRPQTSQEIWARVVEIATGVLAADWASATPPTPVSEDQEFDIASFRKLRDLIVPALGADYISESMRKAYLEALFETSIIHPPSTPVRSLIVGAREGLAAIFKPRLGRTTGLRPTEREKMAYVCLEEMFSLLEARDDVESASTPSTSIQPRTATFPTEGKVQDDGRESRNEVYVRLSRTAAPYVIVRAALTLRTYIADTPLRGLMPQPLSQRREVATIMKALVELRSASEAIPELRKMESEGRKHLLRLYPLLVQVVGVSGRVGDEQVLGLARRALEVVGGELGG